MAVSNTFLVAKGIFITSALCGVLKKIIEEKIRNDFKIWHKNIVSRAKISSRNNNHSHQK